MMGFVQDKCVALAACWLGLYTTNTIFYFYVVMIFANVFRISPVAFSVAMVTFMVWSIISDTIIQHLMKEYLMKARPRVLRRITLYSAAAYLLAFLLPWFGWEISEGVYLLPGVHLLVSMCLFDSCLTFILHLHRHCMRLLDSEKEQASYLRYTHCASVSGALTVFLCEFLSNNLDDIAVFQSTCVLLAVISCGCIAYTAHYVDSVSMNRDEGNTSCDIATPLSLYGVSGSLSQPGFVSLALLEACFVYQLTFLMAFTKITYEYMFAKRTFNSLTLSVYLASTQICPQIAVMLGGPVLVRLGYHRVLQICSVAHIILGVFMMSVGPLEIPLTIFFLVDSILCRVAVSVLNLMWADVFHHRRDTKDRHTTSQAVSNMCSVSQTLNRIAAPAALLVTFAFLNYHGYQITVHRELFKPRTLKVSELSRAIYHLTVYVPTLAGIVQSLALWLYRNDKDISSQASSPLHRLNSV